MKTVIDQPDLPPKKTLLKKVLIVLSCCLLLFLGMYLVNFISFVRFTGQTKKAFEKQVKRWNDADIHILDSLQKSIITNLDTIHVNNR